MAYLDVLNVDRLLVEPGRYSELGGGLSHAYGNRSVAAVVGPVMNGKFGIGGTGDSCAMYVCARGGGRGPGA